MEYVSTFTWGIYEHISMENWYFLWTFPILWTSNKLPNTHSLKRKYPQQLFPYLLLGTKIWNSPNQKMVIINNILRRNFDTNSLQTRIQHCWLDQCSEGLLNQLLYPQSYVQSLPKQWIKLSYRPSMLNGHLLVHQYLEDVLY